MFLEISKKKKKLSIYDKLKHNLCINRLVQCSLDLCRVVESIQICIILSENGTNITQVLEIVPLLDNQKLKPYCTPFLCISFI